MNRNIRAGFGAGEIKRDLLDNLFYLQGKFPEVATRNDWYLAVAYTVCDRLLHRWVNRPTITMSTNPEPSVIYPQSF